MNLIKESDILKKVFYPDNYEEFLKITTGKEDEISKIDITPITNYENPIIEDRAALVVLYQNLKYYFEQKNMYGAKLQEGMAIVISKAALSYDKNSATLDNYFKRGDVVEYGGICNPFEEIARLLLNATMERKDYIPLDAKNIFKLSTAKLNLTAQTQIAAIADALDGNKLEKKCTILHDDNLSLICDSLDSSSVTSKSPISATLLENRQVLTDQINVITTLYSDRMYFDEMMRGKYLYETNDALLTKFNNKVLRVKRNIGIYEKTKQLIKEI